jgi:hypothetical protein
MADRVLRMIRAPEQSWIDRHCNDSRRSELAGERHILELISLGAPLPGILNKLCTALDVQIGNVVSLVLPSDPEANCLWSITQCAVQVGLHFFASADILGREKTRLGTLEIYSCDPRQPTWAEYQLIERVVHLAAIALQRHHDDDNFERPSRGSREDMDDAPERPPFIN